MSITINKGQLTLIRVTPTQRENTPNFLKVSLALSNAVLSSAADPAIIEIREMV